MPYFAAPDRLPEPLPTDATIKCSSEVLKAGHGRRIVRVGQHFVVKYGVLVSLTEGENMLFVRETCDISVPQVFALYSRIHPGGTKVSYIVMEYIQGKSLDSCWDTMSAADKSNTSQRLRLMLDKLRSVPSPGYFGCIGRRPMEEGIFWTRQEDSKDHGLISGPFDTEAQLNNALVEKYLYNSGMPSKARFYRRVLPRVLCDHASVFSHGDLQRKNVLVGDDGNLCLVGWESAGWYPSYWEYASAMFACGNRRDDWHEYVAGILDEYPNEYVWFDMMVRELWS
ncbi:phosphotransferase enzyme family protein [Metarhizium guizhouense ARSEF 977]|uniref:Phosphotransferase enzyme family protein n=1 Tax=Metarhizium guizhouense (strain ARSEF 977) TaxID=1276136 RepID=A0A0B4GGZ8_METGA|nr:phosphotransferase enzyme family protein [Metarhizium guizhouense ARSEF 977]